MGTLHILDNPWETVLLRIERRYLESPDFQSPPKITLAVAQSFSKENPTCRKQVSVFDPKVVDSSSLRHPALASSLGMIERCYSITKNILIQVEDLAWVCDL